MASRSLNRVILIGNLTRDPELKYTPNGTAVCTFGVATNRSWTTQDGQTKEDVQYHRIVAWQKLAELCGKLLSKGRKIYLEGRIIYRSYDGKDGVQRNITEIIMEDFILFDDRRKMEDGGGEVNETMPDEMTGPEPEAKKPGKAAAGKTKKAAATEETVEDKVDPDDIPF